MTEDRLVPMAICYDFDGTLAPGNMQEYDFIPAIGVSPDQFWSEAYELAKASDADTILAYMRLMLKKATAADVRVTRDSFRAFGSTVELFEGVSSWFGRIGAYASSRGARIDHYIISSGLREMIEGTAIAKEFSGIFASGYMYDANGAAVWPALAVNYTTKTQFLFRINKGSLEVYDNSRINKYVPKDERPLPFGNMIYIGDGETDIPCFRLVKDEGGFAAAVYQGAKPGSREQAERIVAEGRAAIAAPADYTEGSAIDSAVKAFIDRLTALSPRSPRP